MRDAAASERMRSFVCCEVSTVCARLGGARTRTKNSAKAEIHVSASLSLDGCMKMEDPRFRLYSSMRENNGGFQVCNVGGRFSGRAGTISPVARYAIRKKRRA